MKLRNEGRGADCTGQLSIIVKSDAGWVQIVGVWFGENSKGDGICGKLVAMRRTCVEHIHTK